MALHGMFLGIPLLLVGFLLLVFMSRKSPHPATYDLSQEWTHPSILWAATDENVGGHHGGHGAEFTVGGGASGTW
ncbi:hypothetical protein [Mycobacterium vicinigordonae]|uniref:Uncharacterized protein n=1 Tax=Mycobacterium vicinigordonae TaxID=1719132 RepID=A0A7D6E3A5_9MYCO|nr:hypothetical protein [Mycobacterium vicinigordonae]QLL10349.1 hypothetical protein H0P51_19195 [Mycobacterium vicinigordonae]